MIIGVFDWMFGKKLNEPQTTTKFKLINDMGDGFYSWNGSIYKSDIVRACIKPKVRAIGKLVAQHVRDSSKGLQTNPDKQLQMLLEDPNPLMSGQLLQEKMATQLELNNNAFAIIKRDNETYQPKEIYPVPAVSVDMLEGPLGDMYLKFHFADGSEMVVPYVDVIHLRQDFNENNLFGDSPQPALADLMEVVTTIDQGMMKAIKNSAVIKWIMKFNSVLKPDDKRMQIEEFTNDYLNVESKGGAVPSDPRYELERVKPESYVPDDKQTRNTTNRIYNFFNTNEDIVQSKYDEDQWNAYYESVIEPIAMQLSGEYTRKIFSKRMRLRGNRVIFESSSLQYASMNTKLGLERMVDRGSMTPNEWRRILNLPPIKGGDEPVRRLDMAEVKGGENNGKQGQNGTEGTDN